MRCLYPPLKSPLEERFIGLPGETQMPVRRLEMVYDAQGRRVSKKLMTNVRRADGTLVNAAWTFERETIFLWPHTPTPRWLDLPWFRERSSLQAGG